MSPLVTTTNTGPSHEPVDVSSTVLPPLLTVFFDSEPSTLYEVVVAFSPIGVLACWATLMILASCVTVSVIDTEPAPGVPSMLFGSSSHLPEKSVWVCADSRAASVPSATRTNARRRMIRRGESLRIIAPSRHGRSQRARPIPGYFFLFLAAGFAAAFAGAAFAGAAFSAGAPV